MPPTSEITALPGEPPSAERKLPEAFEPRTPPRERPGPRHSPYSIDVRSRALTVAVLLICLFGLAQFGRRALGEYWTAQGDRASLESAVRWTPGNAAAWLKLASLQRHAGEDAEAVESIRQAVALLPSDPGPQIELGLALERLGEVEQAGQVLRESAVLDRSFRPRWTLANFYLRTGQVEEFWPWVRQAVEFDTQRLPLALDLCWRAFGPRAGDQILELAVPDTPEANAAYFTYLLDAEKIEPIRKLWPRLEPHISASDVPVVALYLDRLLLADHVEDAVAVWNSMVERKYVPLGKLSAEDGPYLTNGDFQQQVSGLGFDWKIPPAEGIQRVQRRGSDNQYFVEMRLSGGQAEYTPLLIQMMPITPGRRYALIYEYSTNQLPAETGIGWVVRDGRTEQPVATPPPLENAEDFWYETSFSFDAPEDVRLLQLELKYERVPGTARERGRMVMRNIRLEPLTELEAPSSAEGE